MAPGATPVPTPPRRRLANIATRVNVQGGQSDGNAGFIKRFTPAKKVLIRALGPSISVGGQPLAGTLQDPVLTVFDSNGQIATNDNWRSGTQQAEITASGLAPKYVLMTPVDAVRRLLQKIGWTLEDVDLFKDHMVFSERKDGLTFRVEGGARLVVTWTPKIEGDLV